jgi:hypothetical protein
MQNAKDTASILNAANTLQTIRTWFERATLWGDHVAHVAHVEVPGELHAFAHAMLRVTCGAETLRILLRNDNTFEVLQ